VDVDLAAIPKDMCLSIISNYKTLNPIATLSSVSTEAPKLKTFAIKVQLPLGVRVQDRMPMLVYDSAKRFQFTVPYSIITAIIKAN